MTSYVLFKEAAFNIINERVINAADTIIIKIHGNPGTFIQNPQEFITSIVKSNFKYSTLYFQYLSKSGTLIARSPNLNYTLPPFSKTDNNNIIDSKMADGTIIRSYQTSIILNKKKLGYIITALPLYQIRLTLRQLRISLIIVLLCTIIIMVYGINTLISAENLKIQKKFVSYLSHELRTSLAAISGQSDLLLQGNEKMGNKLAPIQKIHVESERMIKMLNDFLVFFRHKTGNDKLHLTNFNSSEIIIEVSSETKKLYPLKKIILNLPEQAMIYADSDRFRQILFNLIENAAKNTSSDGEIAINMDVQLHYFSLKVKDNGIGIKKEDQKRIYKEFYTTENSVKKGTGLGLAIVKWIVSMHRGKIIVDSEPGQGTSFMVYIPNLQKNKV